MAGKRRPWRALWAVGGVLPLWLGERTFALPVGRAIWSLSADSEIRLLAAKMIKILAD